MRRVPGWGGLMRLWTINFAAQARRKRKVTIFLIGRRRLFNR
jgi:hypothetical protein